MKKFFTLFLLSLFTLVSYSQCRNRESSVFFTTAYGIENTLSADLSILSENNLIFGVGVGVLVDDTNYKDITTNVTYKRSEWGVYGVLGYQFEKFIIATNIGNIFIRPNEARVNGELIELNDDTELLYGGLVGYRITPKISLNVGYNNLSDINFGVRFGL